MFSRATAAITIGVALLLAMATYSPAATLRSSASCGAVAGPVWEDPAFGKKGTKWLVRGNGVPCSFAKPWATKLMKTLWRGEAGTKLRGPAGWSCLPTFASTVSTRGTPGSCRKGSKVFFWAPSV